jgi:transglutaminase-like putative cysteine protease
MPHRLRLLHTTEYRYREGVKLGEHRAMLRPRQGHDLHIDSATLEVEPRAVIRWTRDIYGNSLATLLFGIDGPPTTTRLRIHSEAVLTLYPDVFDRCELGGVACRYPFQYPAETQLEIVPYRIPSYPHDSRAVLAWLGDVYQPGTSADTLELLGRLNHTIHRDLEYRHREDPGVQLPCDTLERRSGSCRDYAVLMMEAARHLGFAARFVTGYVQLAVGQHGATHAWTEIFLPGLGWQGFDPTNDKPAGVEHVAVAVARSQEQAMPITGSFAGPAGAFEALDVVVRVEAVEQP